MHCFMLCFVLCLLLLGFPFTAFVSIISGAFQIQYSVCLLRSSTMNCSDLFLLPHGCALIELVFVSLGTLKLRRQCDSSLIIFYVT